MQAPGEALLTKFWETIAEKGIGGLFKPWQLRREGMAAIDLRREEILMLAQAELDAEKIRRGEIAHLRPLPMSLLPGACNASDDDRKEPSLDPKALAELCAEVQLAEEIRKQVNVTRALLHAEEDLENAEQEPPKESVDDDWLFRWRESASQVSTEDLQNLWGRVLAGEVKAPGRYSFRTLEFLRNLNTEEATAINRLSQFRVDGAIFRDASEILDREGVTFGFLLAMQQLGIVAGVEAIGLSYKQGSSQANTFIRAIRSNGMALVVKGPDPSARIDLPVYQVTNIGNAVMSLGTFSANVEYLRKVATHIKLQGFEVELAKCVDAGPNQIRYFDGETL